VRIRSRGPSPSLGSLESLVRAGADELELKLPAELPADGIRALGETGGLAHVALVLEVGGDDVAWADLDPNPCGADEAVLECAADTPLGGLDRRVENLCGSYRRLSIRGLPLCGLPGLDPGKVLANALDAFVPPGHLDLRFERPDRVFLETCRRCSLALACDGFPRDVLASGKELETRPYVSDHERGPSPLKTWARNRSHPPTFVSGRVHVQGVLAGARPCGRMVVPRGDLDRQVEWLAGLRLEVRVVDPGEAPADCDGGSGGPSRWKLSHVFFSPVADRVEEAASLERAYVNAEEGARPMGADVFARAMGRILGYPDCCVQAFVDAGSTATTTDLLRAAFKRSRAFDWRLNCLDPRSPLTLVPHVPCSFDCRPSRELAHRIAGSLTGIFPYLDGTAGNLLGRTVLFVDADRCVAFTGEPDSDGQGLTYTVADRLGARPPAGTGPDKSRFQREVMSALWSGDRLRVEGHCLSVFHHGGEILAREFRSAPLLMPF